MAAPVYQCDAGLPALLGLPGGASFSGGARFTSVARFTSGASFASFARFSSVARVASVARSAGGGSMRTALLVLLSLVATMVCAGTASAAAPRYVALGDSAASGPGITPIDLSSPGCFRSQRNYPKLAAAAVGVPITDVTCSGADTGDMTASQSTDLGDVPPQFDALTADTTLVTLQIGGNDAGLVGLAESCLNLLPEQLGGSSCADENTAGGQDVYGARVDAVGPKAAAVLDGIHQRAPSARV